MHPNVPATVVDSNKAHSSSSSQALHQEVKQTQQMPCAVTGSEGLHCSSMPTFCSTRVPLIVGKGHECWQQLHVEPGSTPATALPVSAPTAHMQAGTQTQQVNANALISVPEEARLSPRPTQGGWLSADDLTARPPEKWQLLVLAVASRVPTQQPCLG